MYELFSGFALYNKKTNEEIIKLASSMNNGSLKGTEKFHFNSIPETLKHLLITDFRWLDRLESITGKKITDDETGKLRKELEESSGMTVRELIIIRKHVDDRIIDAISLLEGSDFKNEVEIKFGQGNIKKPLWKLLLQWFNHQTHHKGQISVLFDLAGTENDFSSMINKI